MTNNQIKTNSATIRQAVRTRTQPSVPESGAESTLSPSSRGKKMRFVMAHPDLDPPALVRLARRAGLNIAPSYIKSVRWMVDAIPRQQRDTPSETPASKALESGTSYRITSGEVRAELPYAPTLPAEHALPPMSVAVPAAPPYTGFYQPGFEAYIAELGWGTVLRQAVDALGVERVLGILAELETRR